jgi:hypothetical protein
MLTALGRLGHFLSCGVDGVTHITRNNTGVALNGRTKRADLAEIRDMPADVSTRRHGRSPEAWRSRRPAICWHVRDAHLIALYIKSVTLSEDTVMDDYKRFCSTISAPLVIGQGRRRDSTGTSESCGYSYEE